MFYFPVAFSQVHGSGDGSSGSEIVGIALGWAAKERERYLLRYWSPPQFRPSSSLFLFIPSIFQTPQSAFYYLSAIQALIPPPHSVVVSAFSSFLSIFYLIITICCFPHIVEIATIHLSFRVPFKYYMWERCVYFQCRRPPLSTHLFTPFLYAQN